MASGADENERSTESVNLAFSVQSLTVELAEGAGTVKARHVLKKMKVGNGVAEFDDSLERYFVETEVFRSIVDNRYDIIAGDKGTGKTALFKILRQRYTTLTALDDVEIVPAFNLQGSPIFARLNEDEPYSEAQYSTLWKGYFLALAGNWILLLYEDDWTPAMQGLSDLLTTTGLRSLDDTPSTVFSTIVNLFRRLTHQPQLKRL